MPDSARRIDARGSVAGLAGRLCCALVCGALGELTADCLLGEEVSLASDIGKLLFDGCPPLMRISALPFSTIFQENESPFKLSNQFSSRCQEKRKIHSFQTTSLKTID
jgi:hypothetical protein